MHVGTVDASVVVGDIKQIAIEFRKTLGKGEDSPTTTSVDVLGWTSPSKSTRWHAKMRLAPGSECVSSASRVRPVRSTFAAQARLSCGLAYACPVRHRTAALLMGPGAFRRLCLRDDETEAGIHRIKGDDFGVSLVPDSGADVMFEVGDPAADGIRVALGKAGGP